MLAKQNMLNLFNLSRWQYRVHAWFEVMIARQPETGVLQRSNALLKTLV